MEIQVFGKFNAVKYKINFTTIYSWGCWGSAGGKAGSGKGRIENQEMTGSEGVGQGHPEFDSGHEQVRAGEAICRRTSQGPSYLQK